MISGSGVGKLELKPTRYPMKAESSAGLISRSDVPLPFDFSNFKRDHLAWTSSGDGWYGGCHSRAYRLKMRTAASAMVC